MYVIYFLVAIVATVLGAIAGLGGGVIIKPVLDTLGHYDLATISVLSSFTVLSMAIVSTIKQLKSGFKIEKRMILLSLGAIIGGMLGSKVFNAFMSVVSAENTAKGIQSVILALLLIIIVFKKYLPKYNINNTVASIVIGLLLGGISSFLGIGGGPINVAILCMLMGMTTKDAAVNSIFIILLAQISKLSLITVTQGLAQFNLEMLVCMIPGGILGGFIGSKFNRKLTEEVIVKIFNITIILLILLNVYNAINFFS